MEPKSAAATLSVIAVALLALGVFTDGIVFYVALCLPLAVLAADSGSYLLLVRDLRRNLSVSRRASVRELLVGSAVTVTYDLDYRGRGRIPAACTQQADGSVSVEGSPCTMEIAPGRQSVEFVARPSARGSHVLKGMRLTVESRLFRGTLAVGDDLELNAYVQLSQGRTTADSAHGRRQRISLPGSEVLRQGSGSDFSRMRDFQPGDSTRNIDWARSSRSSTLVVRDFEDERTLPQFILIDVDPSMETGTGRTELESAVRLATVLAGHVLLDNERVGLACFSKAGMTCFLPLAGGKGQMSHIQSRLSSLEPMAGDPAVRAGFPSLQEAESIRRMLGEAPAGEKAVAVMDETIRQFTANVLEDGFIRAVTQASLSTGTPCSIVVITNLSMGIASLLSGIRIATYYGHSVSVALTPHVWYAGARMDDPGKCYDLYRQAKDVISRLRGGKIDVVELSACEDPAARLYRGRVRATIKRTKEER